MEIIDCSEAEKQLKKYADEYYKNEFVPIPTAQDAVDGILETVGYVNLDDRLPFVKAIMALLEDWQQKELEDWTSS